MGSRRTRGSGHGGERWAAHHPGGNVGCAGPRRRVRGLAQGLLEELGAGAAVRGRSGAELAAVVAAKPYAADGTTVSVTFLAERAGATALSGIDPAAFGADEYAVIGREIFLHTPDGYGRTKLNNAFWERRLSTVATTRNWNTVLALAEMTA